MKTIFTILLIASSHFFFSQEVKYRIEFDNSQYYSFMSKYYELQNQNYKKENAEHIKHYAEKYVAEVDKALSYFNKKNDFLGILDREDLILEIDRLKNYGVTIYNLLNLLEKDELTVAKTKYTIEGAFEELNNSVNSGKLSELNKKVSIMEAIELSTQSDTTEQIEQITKNASGLTSEYLKSLYQNIGDETINKINLTYRDFLKDILKGIIYEQEK